MPGLKLILQADGDYWHGREGPARENPMVMSNRANDKRLDTYATKAGWRVLRLWETDLRKHPGDCRARISAEVMR